MDQPYWANAMHRLGVASAPLFRAEATPEAVARSLSQVLAEPQYRRRAMLMAEKIRSEGGAMAAAEILREHLADPRFVLRQHAH
jgi:sterol 3beta-glucosyltransferase